MEVHRRSSWLLLLLGLTLLATALQVVQGEVEAEGPSESECRPYIEKALKELETGEGADGIGDSNEELQTVEITTDDSDQPSPDSDGEDDDNVNTDSTETEAEAETVTETEAEPEGQQSDEKDDTQEAKSEEAVTDDENKTEETTDGDSKEEAASSKEAAESTEATKVDEADQSKEDEKPDAESKEGDSDKTTEEESKEGEAAEAEDSKEDHSKDDENKVDDAKDDDTKEDDTKEDDSKENDTKEDDTKEDDAKDDDSKEAATKEDDTKDESKEDSKEASKESSKEEAQSIEDAKDEQDSKEETADKKEESVETAGKDDESKEDTKSDENKDEDDGSREKREVKVDSQEEEEKKGEDAASTEEASDKDSKEEAQSTEGKDSQEGSDEDAPEEDLSLDIEIPEDLRPRDHVEQLLKVDKSSSDTEEIINRVSAVTLKELKKLYENAIKPLEGLYKYRDLSNRHFGDAEIFSKPLILFMGPWSGGKSSLINYLLNNEYNTSSLRTGAEPSPAYFNILMHGEEPEVIDGTELAADFTFSGLQKFGQGLEERLRGTKLPSKLLEKVNIVEIPGILEVRKQISRVFPFNDACQWFIDRADIIFLVYDPSKLDVGPETEAILDQLKGREHQTRIILNKADQVKPEELMRVQGALIWNISPLMSSPQPPIMYTTSLWSRPYESWAPVRLLQAQERAFLRDLRGAVDKRIENKIASARRFAVRVRNHAKMVDCYLTTYYNHKSVFGNRKQVADAIIEHPQDYHIYEGLSTLTNISRYDLPDPEVYKDFFRLNALYDFQQLSATCTYFRGCPINRLDVAIAYDLPELVGTHRRNVETALGEASAQAPAPGS